MARIKLNDYFYLDEFIDATSHLNLIKLLNIATFIRQNTGLSVTINNYAIGGSLSYRGFRPINCTIGASNSQHKYFNAIDINIGNWSSKQMFEWAVRRAPDLYLIGVRRIEDISITPTWLHLDCKEHNQKVIHIINQTQIIKTIPV